MILIAEDALETARAETVRFSGQLERGGILLGTRRGDHFHVNEATLPKRGDRSQQFAFHRSAVGHQAVALSRWQRSRQLTDWLGEWHSHPQKIPSPSSVDLASWQSIVRRRGASMLFLIIGYSDIWLGLVEPGARMPARYIEAERSENGIGYVPG
jgi:integrative and conjugative element protein (TIGR02256 family)